jgi:hypothetical protein
MSKKIPAGNQLLNDLRRVAKLVGHAPTAKEYSEHGQYGATTLWRRFGGWYAALDRAGLRHEKRRTSEEDLRRDLQRVQRKIDRTPSRGDYKTHGRFSERPFINRVKGTWADALVYFLGVDSDEAKRASYPTFRSDSGRLEELRALSQKLKHTPGTQEATAHGIRHQVLTKRFGSWAAACKAAGLAPPQLKRQRARHVGDEELIADVLSTARMLGRLPTTREQDRLGRFKSTAVAWRFGTWSKALERIGRQATPTNKHLSAVADPVRDFLKNESAEAITEFFQKKK